MKAIVWLWPIIVTLLCASHFVRTAQRGEYGEYEDSTLVQNDFLLEKRIKPSLSIVNPLDVLRQRLMLETARRQQREQNRQVEINRQILKQVGKRKDDSLLLRTIFDFLRQDDDNKYNLNDDDEGNNDNDQRQQQQQHQQQQQQQPQHHQQQARYFYRLH